MLSEEFELVGGPLNGEKYVALRDVLALHFPVDKEGNVVIGDKLVKVETKGRFVVYENKGGKMVHKED